MDKIKADQEALQQKLFQMSEKLYKSAQPQQDASGSTSGTDAGAGTGPDGNVYDADFHEVDGDDK